MNIRKIISKRIRHDKDGVQIAGDVNAVISANVGERGSSTHVSSKQTARVEQDSSPLKADEAKEEER